MFKRKKNKLKTLLEEARQNRFAVGQFNFSTVCQLRGVAQASEESNTSLICGTSENEAKFVGIREAVFLRDELVKNLKTNIFLNLDHGRSFESIKFAIDSGYDMVHFDGSKLPFEENVKITKKIVQYAGKRGVVVEGEISKIGGSSQVSEAKIEEAPLTSLEKIAKFIAETGVDCIALDVGNVHGIHSKMPRLQLERVNELQDIVKCYVVLHGGSGIVNREIADAVNRGVVKININTELRVAWRDAILKEMQRNPEESTPYKILPQGQEAVKQKVNEKIKLFNNK